MSSATPDPTNLYAGYPLQFHNNGRITRKLRGKLVYCGRWGNIVSGKMVWVDDVPAVAAAALEEWNRVWPYLRDGRTPPAPAAAGALTVGQLCNHFHATKEAEMERGKISARTFAGYHRACQHACKWLGKHAAVIDLTPDDIAAMYAKLAKGRNVVTQANYVRNLRMLFKHAYDPDGLQLIDRPVRMGKGFRQPVTTMLRRAEQDRRAKHGKRLLTEEELRALLDKATPIMRASILLGVNCGYGSADIAALETSHLDLTSGWADMPRVKTAVERRCPLWPETIEALRIVLAQRRQSKDTADSHIVFLSRYRGRMMTVSPKGGVTDTLGKGFDRLLRSAGLKRRGLGLYALRHVTETIGGGARDQQALDVIMGHVIKGMGARYVEEIADERLRGVVNHVRGRRFGKVTKAGAP